MRLGGRGGAPAACGVLCLGGVLPLESVPVVGRDPARAREFCAALGRELGIAVEVAPDARRAVADADVVTCATTARTPVVAGADLRPGTHVDAVGAVPRNAPGVDTRGGPPARATGDTYAGALEGARGRLSPPGGGPVG